ncbi:MAG TPA: bifunctional pyr operon transcriptional regulator/uracil phosphoribosyltransferase PyrR [Rhodothermales bacterium]|nr:bifunctional pyr operon transcriptional regulator/uracil phosphoribosyltransferase PyrR [Rhodothermales bacterium]
MSKNLLISASIVQRMIARMAHEVVERNRGAENILLLGIIPRGAVVALHFAQAIFDITGYRPEMVTLDVNPFRYQPLTSGKSHSAFQSSTEGKDLLLVDDVLFSGLTIRAALEAIKPNGMPHSVQLAVLIDRGYRKWPLQPDYCGRYIPTKHQEQILVDDTKDLAVFLEE